MTELIRDPLETDVYFVRAAATLVPARNGNGVQCTSSAQAADYTLPVPSDYLMVGFAFRPATLAASQVFLELRSGVLETQIRTAVNGSITAHRSTTLIATSAATGIITAATWHYVEVYARLHDTLGFVVVRVNGVEVLNFPAGDTKASTPTAYTIVRLTSISSVTHLFDDVYVKTGAGETFNGDIGAVPADLTSMARVARHAVHVAAVNTAPIAPLVYDTHHVARHVLHVLRPYYFTPFILTEPFNNFTAAPWVVTSTPVITAGRNGFAAEINSISDRLTYTIPAGSQTDTFTIGFAWFSPVLQPAHNIISVNADANATLHSRLTTTTSGELHAGRGGTAIVGASLPAGTVAPNTWYYIEYQCRLHDTLGSVVVRINGVEVINLTNVDTKNAGTSTVYDTIELSSPSATSGGINRYDDLYFRNDAVFQGDPAVCNTVLVEPFNDLDVNDWALLGAVNLVPGRNGDCLRISSATGSARYTWTGSGDSVITFGFALRTDSLAAAYTLARTYAGVNGHNYLQVTTAGALAVTRATTVLATSAAGVITVNTWAYVEAQILVDDAVGWAKVNVNGIEVINVSAVDTRNGAVSTIIDELLLMTAAPGTINVDYDDLYIRTGGICGFLGDGHPILVAPHNARQSTRVAFATPPAVNAWYRNFRSSVRVAFGTPAGAPTEVRLAQIAVRALTTGSPAAQLAQIAVRSLTSLGAPAITCVDVLTEPFNDFTTNGWTSISSDSTIVAGRTGTAAKVVGYADTISYAIPAEKQSDVVTVGAAWRTATFSETPIIFHLYNATGRVGRLSCTATGAVALHRDTSGIGVLGALTAAGAIVANTWQYIELQVKLSTASDGWAKLRIDGVEKWSVTGVQTADGAGNYSRLDIGAEASTSTERLWDDLYLRSGPACTFLGDPTVLPNYARVAQTSMRALTRGTPAAQIARTSMRALTSLAAPPAGATMKVWNGTAFVSAPVKVWNGTAFVDAAAVKTWSGSAFV